MLVSSGVLHEWHGTVNNSPRIGPYAGQLIEKKTDSRQVSRVAHRGTIALSRRHMGFLSRFGAAGARLNAQPLRWGHSAEAGSVGATMHQIEAIAAMYAANRLTTSDRRFAMTDKNGKRGGIPSRRQLRSFSAD